jgi:hypothetical protein
VFAKTPQVFGARRKGQVRYAIEQREGQDEEAGEGVSEEAGVDGDDGDMETVPGCFLCTVNHHSPIS